MQSVPLHLLAVIAAAVLVLAMAAYTLRAHRNSAQEEQENGKTWKRAYHLSAELAAGRAAESNSARLLEFIDGTPEIMLAAAAIAVAVRQEADEVDPVLYSTVAKSRLSKELGERLKSEDANTQIEALEIIEVLHIRDLLGDAAALTTTDDATVVRAACDVLVEIEPSMGIGVLIGLANDDTSWVVDSLGRAAARLKDGPIPLSPAQWSNAPMLAQRALLESHSFDQATLATAVACLVGAVESESSTKRLAAVTALSLSIDHPAAQLALAGALGAEDRMTRFATAANLMDSVSGRKILRNASNRDDGSDAAQMAAELLWLNDSAEGLPKQLVAS